MPELPEVETTVRGLTPVLAGQRLTEGLAGQWIQPYWLWLTADQHGGTLAVEAVEGRVSMTVRMPS